MTAIRDIFAEAERYKLAIALDGDQLDLKAPAKPPETFLDKLRECKPLIVAELRARELPALDRWYQGVESITESDPPSGCAPETWWSIIDAAVFFLDAHGSHAAALGWNDTDLFGVHPEHPFEPPDCMGLVVRHHTMRVIAMTDETAILAGRPGQPKTNYTKTLRCGAVPIWELCESRAATWNT